MPAGSISPTSNVELRPGRIGRGVRHVAIHLTNHFSNLVGDEVVGRRARAALLRRMGADIAQDATVHGGSHFSDPRNLLVGRGSLINRNCYFDLHARVTIGDEVGIGHGVTIITTVHDLGPSHRRGGYTYHGQGVTIHSGAWLGANVTIMPGVVVGKGAVVGTGSLVLQDVDPDTCVAGVPARIIRALPTGDPDRAS